MSSLEPITSLSLDIGSAVFRIATLVRHKRLREELESAAVCLVRDLDNESIDLLERLVFLSKAVGEVGEVNAEVLYRELGNLRQMMLLKSSELSGRTADINVNKFFTKPTNTGLIVSRTQNIRAKDRQTAILEVIRQFPNNCRMKDLVIKFPGASERTLRSDIQKLIEGNFIERLGGKSGPSSFFRALDVTRNIDGENASVDSILLPEAATKY